MDKKQTVKNLNLTNKRFKHFVNLSLEPFNVNNKTIRILNLIKENENITSNELAKRMNTDKSAISRGINTLEKEGLIVRKSNSGDKRIKTLQLTDLAETKIKMYSPIYDEIVSIALEGFTKEDRVIFNTYIKKMEANILKHTNEDKNA